MKWERQKGRNKIIEKSYLGSSSGHLCRGAADGASRWCRGGGEGRCVSGSPPHCRTPDTLLCLACCPGAGGEWRISEWEPAEPTIGEPLGSRTRTRRFGAWRTGPRPRDLALTHLVERKGAALGSVSRTKHEHRTKPHWIFFVS